MRIRKRFLSLSAVITATPSSSDLQSGGHHQHQHQLVQHQEEVHPNVNPHVVYSNSQSHFSDTPNDCYLHPIPPRIGLQPSTWISSGAGSHDPNKTYKKELESERKKELIVTTTGCSRKESISLCTDEANSHDLVLKGGWFEGDRLVPIKKRRGNCSFEKRLKLQYCHDTTNIKEEEEEEEEEEDHNINETMTMMTDQGALMKSSKALKKNDYKAAVAARASSLIINKKKKKKKKDWGMNKVITTGGSRCSRVNGRGWRCSQQTLVGYSLCDHHLGKGRLIRSIITTTTTTSTLPGRIKPLNNIINAQKPHQQTKTTKESQLAADQATNEFEDDEELEFEDWDDKVESIMSSSSTEIIQSKRTKQQVKARSLSSLLYN